MMNGSDPETIINQPVVDKYSGKAFRGALGGVFLLVLSMIFIIGGLRLGLGVPTRLGTGAFPFMTGLLVFVLAAVIFVQETRGAGIALNPDWVAFFSVLTGVAAFAVCIDLFGLFPSAFFTVIIASMPDKKLKFSHKAVLGLFVACVCWVLFIKILNLPFRAFVGI